MSNLQNNKWMDIKKDYFDELAWKIYQEGYLSPEEDERFLLLNTEDREYVYEQWARINAETV